MKGGSLTAAIAPTPELIRSSRLPVLPIPTDGPGPTHHCPGDSRSELAEARLVSSQVVVTRAREFIGHALTGNTQYSETELDAIVNLIAALDEVPQPSTD